MKELNESIMDLIDEFVVAVKVNYDLDCMIHLLMMSLMSCAHTAFPGTPGDLATKEVISLLTKIAPLLGEVHYNRLISAIEKYSENYGDIPQGISHENLDNEIKDFNTTLKSITTVDDFLKKFEEQN